MSVRSNVSDALEASAGVGAAASICEYLPWDSQFFGRRIARLKRQELTPGRIVEALAWCRDHAIECLYYLAPAGDFQTIRLAEKNGFELVDIRVTLTHPLETMPRQESNARVVTPADIPELSRIAAHGFHGTRFYNDSHFDRGRCAQLYSTWIQKSCEKQSGRVFVIEQSDAIAGFIACSLDPSSVGHIDLIAVDTRFQRRGLARQLVNTSLLYFKDQGMVQASVVTQGQNVKSQKLYQQCGYLMSSLELWYHRWFRAPSGPVEDR